MDFDRKLSRNEKLIEPELISVLNKLGLELYDFDYQHGTSTFRVFIYNSSTKTASLDDCVSVDRELSDFFEGSDLPDNVRLEVSSPGLFRHLKSLKHFQMSVGENIKVKLLGKVDGVKSKIIEGNLVSVNDDSIKLQDKRDKKIFDINFSNIKSANAEYIF